MDEIIANNGEIYFEARTLDDNKEYKWYSFTVRGVPKSKKHPRSFILFKKDINDVKKADEEHMQALTDALDTAQKASKAKGEFLSRVSHEIRTPLNAIIGYLTIAGMPDSSEEKYLTALRTARSPRGIC